MKRITIKSKLETEIVVSDVNTEEARHIPWLQPTEKMHQLIAYKNAELQKRQQEKEDEEAILEEIVEEEKKKQEEQRRYRCVIL